MELPGENFNPTNIYIVTRAARAAVVFLQCMASTQVQCSCKSMLCSDAASLLSGADAVQRI